MKVDVCDVPMVAYSSSSGLGCFPTLIFLLLQTDKTIRIIQYIYNLYTGTNEHASQKGMTFGGVRHVGDIRTDDMNVDSKQILISQSGER